MKIYTKSGDQGNTGLFAGPRVSKDHPRISAYGSVDELNAVLGTIAATAQQIVRPGLPLAETVQQIQQDLFSVGAELATPAPDEHGMRLLDEKRVLWLEGLIDDVEAQLEPLTTFILPGGSEGASALHLARTVCRRAERDVVHLATMPEVADCARIVIYLNRLSDLLFVLARQHNSQSGVADVPWTKPS